MSLLTQNMHNGLCKSKKMYIKGKKRIKKSRVKKQ